MNLISKPTNLKVLIFTLLFFQITIGNTQNIVRDLVFKLRGLDENDQTDATKKELIKNFWSELKFLDKYEREQSKFKGEVEFGFNADESDNQSLYKLNAGIKVTRGIYPGELEFSSDLNVVLNNGQFNENVSNLFIAYDYNPRLWFETFGFTSRFTDAFLGVQQRYEVGGGVIFNWYIGELTKKGEEEKAKLEVFDPIDLDDFNKKAGIWGICAEHCTTHKHTPISSKEVTQLKRLNKDTRLSIKKLYSKIRLGFLIGIFAETEKIAFSDSLATNLPNNEKIFRTIDFNPTQKFRWELRPTIEIKPNDTWNLKFYPYYKLPMPWTSNESEIGGTTDERFDYRFDLQSSLNINLKTPLTQNKSVVFSLKYNRYFDNSPQRQFIQGFSDPEGNPLLFEAASLHELYVMALKIGF